MVSRKKFLSLVAVGVILCMYGDTRNALKFIDFKDKLRKEIQDTKNELNSIPYQVNKQAQDSIAHFDKTAPNSLLLQSKQQEKLNLQIKVTKIAEQSWREYWAANFPQYKNYINSCFSPAEIKDLSKYINKAYFSLSCDIDINYYRSLDDILYGPYWREFNRFISADAPKLAKKYVKVRQSAEKKYPYIFSRNIFYDGQKVTSEDDLFINKIFTESIETGREILREKSVCPDANMYNFNKLRNISKVFTSDLHFFVESIFVMNQENINLQSELFAPYYAELLDITNQIIMLNTEIRKLNIQHEKDVKNIRQHFDTVTHQLQSYKSERIEFLKYMLENGAVQRI